MKKSLSEMALESGMIVFSVLLALAAGSWADARRERALVTQARTSFAAEIRANRSRLTKVLPYHEALTTAVLAADSAGDMPSYAEWRRRVPIWSGFAPPDVAATAWQSAIATGAIAHMSYEEVAALSTVYTLQGRFDAFNTSYLPLFDFSDPAMAGTVRRMHAYMQTVLSYETALSANYDSALVRLSDVDHAP
jgi:type II secretory pathway pseudopilin PulG